MATPYVISSDLVSAYPAKSLEIAQYIDGFKADLALVQNAQTGTTYSFVAADFTKLVTLSNASPVAVTLPLEATVPWSTGTQLRLLNQGAGTVTVAGDVGVTINGTPLTLAQYKAAVITKTGTDTWTILPFSGGSAPAVISSTTGSPTITTDGSATVYTFTGDGTIVVGTEGVVEIFTAAGGGGGGYDGGGGGGGGGTARITQTLAAATYTVTIGAGGAAGTVDLGGNGGVSSLDGLTSGAFALGGGGAGGGVGGGGTGPGKAGANGGGGGTNAAALTAGTSSFTPLGFSGGNGLVVAAKASGGGGGGFTAAGVTALAAAAGAGGAGKTDNPTGSSLDYCAGGGGGGFTGVTAGAAGGASAGAGNATPGGVGANGAANRGGGAGGGAGASGNGGAGGSGVVIVRVG
jgi:hypothetical protein